MVHFLLSCCPKLVQRIKKVSVLFCPVLILCKFNSLHVESLLVGLFNECRKQLISAVSCCDQAQQCKSIMQCNLGNGDEWSLACGDDCHIGLSVILELKWNEYVCE